MSSLTPQQRTLRAQTAANSRWATAPTGARDDFSATGRRGHRARYERQFRDQFPGETDAQIAARVDNAMAAHMARMTLASSRARAARKAGGPA